MKTVAIFTKNFDAVTEKHPKRSAKNQTNLNKRKGMSQIAFETSPFINFQQKNSFDATDIGHRYPAKALPPWRDPPTLLP